jgi:hypothetical protein
MNHVVKMISNALNEETFNSIVENDLSYHLDKNTRSYYFQEYYFQVTGDIDNFLEDPKFFRHFKYQYAIQGADINFLNRLESNKQLILDYIRSGKLAQLYFKFFSMVDAKGKTGLIRKDFGSFFTKVVHTIKPSTYCALDNQIKDYFNLSKESYFISFLVVSQAYRNWSAKNIKIVSSFNDSIKRIDRNKIINFKKLTDLKLLDLIFWYKANILKEKGML